MSDIKSSVDLTVEAKSIYEAWNWDMLEAQMESEYDRGAFRELVNMHVNLIDNDVSLITTIESLQEKADEFEERYTDSQFHVKALSDVEAVHLQQIESQKEEIEKAVNEIKFQVERNDRQREGYFKLEKEILSHGPEGRNYTNQQYVDLLQKFESLKAITELKNDEIETLKDQLGDIHYGLTCLDPVLEMPEKGYVRNQYNKLLDVCKEFRHE